MATHAQSVFTFFIPYAEVVGAASVPECIGILLKEFLYNQDLSEWAEQIESLENRYIYPVEMLESLLCHQLKAKDR